MTQLKEIIKKGIKAILLGLLFIITVSIVGALIIFTLNYIGQNGYDKDKQDNLCKMKEGKLQEYSVIVNKETYCIINDIKYQIFCYKDRDCYMSIQ